MQQPRAGRSRLAYTFPFVILLGFAGCALPRPDLFPVAPLEERTGATGEIQRSYDLDGDGRADFVEILGADGRVRAWRDGEDSAEIAIPPVGDPASRPQVLIVLDSVPYELVGEAWNGGRFRLFAPPSAIIAPFPVMTDLSLNDLFGTGPSAGVEADHYDGVKRTDAWDVYIHEKNSPWVAAIDVRRPFCDHADAYLEPQHEFDRELAMIEHALRQRRTDTIGYVLATSGLGLQRGQDGHHAAIVELDRFCQALVHRFRGEIELTLLSDHGHSLVRGRRLLLDRRLREMGYRLSERLHRPEDVILPEFGQISCAALYTRSPARLAADAARIEGVDLAMHRAESGEIVVEGRNGRARVSQAGTRFRYVCEWGDPLMLEPILARLRHEGRLDDAGFVEDEVLFAATTTHVYPDPLRRICRAFDGLVEHVPDVLLSFDEGWSAGSPFMALFINFAADHGCLKRQSTTGFVMSTAGRLPPFVRMDSVAQELRRLGAWPERRSPDAAAR
jgi:hypothetical protein